MKIKSRKIEKRSLTQRRSHDERRKTLSETRKTLIATYCSHYNKFILAKTKTRENKKKKIAFYKLQ